MFIVLEERGRALQQLPKLLALTLSVDLLPREAFVTCCREQWTEAICRLQNSPRGFFALHSNVMKSLSMTNIV